MMMMKMLMMMMMMMMMRRRMMRRRRMMMMMIMMMIMMMMTMMIMMMMMMMMRMMRMLMMMMMKMMVMTYIDIYLTFPFLKTTILNDLSNQMLSPSPCNEYFARSLYLVGSFYKFSTKFTNSSLLSKAHLGLKNKGQIT